MASVRDSSKSIRDDVADVVLSLVEYFSDEIDDRIKCTAHHAALERYIRHVARIGITAGSKGFNAFRDVCVAFQDILRELHKVDRELSRQERDILEEWPILVLRYFESPQDKANYADVVDHLKRLEKFLPLPRLEYDELLANFSREHDFGISTRELQQKVPESREIASNPDEALKHATLDPSHIPSLVVAIQQELNEIGADIEAANSSFGENRTSEMASSLEFCADRFEILALCVSEEGLSGLTDIFLILEQSIREHGRSGNVFDSFSEDLSNICRTMLLCLGGNKTQSLQKQLLAQLMQFSWITTLTDHEANDIAEFFAHDIETLYLCSDSADNHVEEEHRADPADSVMDKPEANCIVQREEELTTEATDRGNPSLPDTKLNEDDSKLVDTELFELLTLVCEEIAQGIEQLDGLLEEALSQTRDSRKIKLLEYRDSISRYTSAIQEIGFSALYQVLEVINQNLDYVVKDPSLLEGKIVEKFSLWPVHLIAYLSDYRSAANVDALIDYLSDGVWLSPPETELMDSLRHLLLSPTLALPQQEGQARQQLATEDDISLRIPEDVNPDLLESLLGELPDLTEKFTLAITKIADGIGTMDDLQVAQRIAHTLKGSANTVGVAGIANLTHNIEDILAIYSGVSELPSGVAADLLIRSADTLESMSESLLGIGPASNEALQIYQNVLDMANKLDQSGVPAVISVDQEAVTPELPSAETKTAESTAVELQVAKEPESEDSVIRVSASLIDELLRLAGESIIVNRQLQDRLTHAIEHNRQSADQNYLLQQLTHELEHLIDVQGFGAVQGNISGDDFDVLEMDRYNQLHTVARRLTEAATDNKEISAVTESHLMDLESLLADHINLHKHSQEYLLRTRMVPVQTIVARLNRAVRQTARLTGKQVQLTVLGADTLMDSDILGELIDPLMHILRNAIDHGIESDEIRRQCGKASHGEITLEFSRTGNQLFVKCADDGAGLDYRTIEAIARENGLIPEGDDVGIELLKNLILQSGFSTRPQVTQISGRGVGMDIIYNKIISMKGTVSIESETGKGCTFSLQIPVTYISVNALLVRSSNMLCAVATRNVQQIVHPAAGNIENIDSNPVFRLHQDSHTLTPLCTLLNLLDEKAALQLQPGPVVMVKTPTGQLHAVMVDEIIANQDLVVKPLGQFVPHVAGIEGATILGDGSVAPVMDISDLLQHRDANTQGDCKQVMDNVQFAATQRMALVVDDSLSARRSLAEFIEDMGYEVETANDGLDALEVMNSKLPDIILVDLEMPRMNGLELAQHVRAQQHTRQVPIIMITSRSTDRHKRLAESAGVDIYLTKPYSEEILSRHIEQQLNRDFVASAIPVASGGQ